MCYSIDSERKMIMELVRSKVLVVFVVLMLGVTLISSLNNSRRDHFNHIQTIQAQ